MNESVLTTLTWLIPVGPLAAFALILLVTYRSQRLSFLTAWAGILLALGLGWTVSFSVVNQYFTDAHHLEEHPVVVESNIPWLPIGDYYAAPQGAAFAAEHTATAEEEMAHGEEDAAHGAEGEAAMADEHAAATTHTGYSGPWFTMGVLVDPLTAVMLFMVPFAVFMIFMYSVGYHNFGKPRGNQLGVPNHGQEEPMFSRFFAMMSLFAGAMLTLVVADNLLLLFVGWEVMGFCSYSLIGFWYARDYENESLQKLPPRKASIKAFMTTRVADVVMLMGIVFFYRTFGTLNFAQALTAESIAAAADSLTLGTVGIGLMAVMIFTGTAGKSAQWPFHVWLPNAMEGPTPVSAVIHAAAMVSAGIFLLLRIFPLIAVGLEANMTFGLIIAGIGAFTALMAATIAVAQNDVKGVLAYSTISQLGFMVAAIGLGAYVAAAFHLITHAFFKALLFLGSGSVIHGMEHGAEHVHDHHTDPQDMMKMGGLREKMPITYWTFLIGGMALSGFPFVTAGFWSKDEIFADAFYQGTHGNPLGWMVLIMLSLAAFLTAFYTMRQISLTFLGKARSPLAEHAHESNGYMTTPLVLLSFFAVTAGWAGIPDYFLGIEWGKINFFHHFVGATLYKPLELMAEEGLVGHGIKTLPWSWVPLIVSIGVAGGGLLLGWWVYGRKPLTAEQPDPLIGFLGKPLHGFLENKWYWDEAYERIFVRPTLYFSEVIAYEVVDKGIIDGFLHLVARTIYTIARGMIWFEQRVVNDGIDLLKDWFLEMTNEARSFQSGKVQEYALYSVMFIFVVTAFMLLLNAGIFG